MGDGVVKAALCKAFCDEIHQWTPPPSLMYDLSAVAFDGYVVRVSRYDIKQTRNEFK